MAIDPRTDPHAHLEYTPLPSQLRAEKGRTSVSRETFDGENAEGASVADGAPAGAEGAGGANASDTRGALAGAASSAGAGVSDVGTGGASGMGASSASAGSANDSGVGGADVGASSASSTGVSSDGTSRPSATSRGRTAPADPFLRAPNEDDDGYDPYSDRPADNPLFEEDPWI